MKAKLWIVIIVVIGVLGFFMGYSTPSFLHADSAAGAVKKADEGPKLDKAAEEYYKKLQQDEN